MSTIATIWNSNSEEEWKRALDRYWIYVKPSNRQLEEEMDELKLEHIAHLNQQEWYDFLHDRYFKWKFTAPNRYATTTRHLRKYIEFEQLDVLVDIKKRLLKLDLADTKKCLTTAEEIRGLGISGASGLLSLMYPHVFSTVDQFVVKALRNVPYLRESALLQKMNPEGLTLKDGVVLVHLMQRKAQENNTIFNTNFWTPRRIDMVLWGARE